MGVFDEALVGLNALINVLCGIHGIMFVSICKGIWLHRVKVYGYTTYADMLACRLQKGKKKAAVVTQLCQLLQPHDSSC